MEEQALRNVIAWEKNGELGAFENLSKAFFDVRNAQNFVASTPTVTSQKGPLLLDENGQQIKAAAKFWKTDHHVWNQKFRTMQNELEDLKGYYRDKQVIQFDKNKEEQTNRKIRKTMMKIQKLFKEMKSVVDKLNKALYSKDEHKYRGQNKLFETPSEWRVAERIVIDLTDRLRQKQQLLNETVVSDKKISEYIDDSAATATGQDQVELKKLDDFFKMQENVLKQEQQEVQDIVNAIKDIVKMVSDMSLMIHEQGTIVDRIDYNLEVASVRTLKGKEWFEKAEKKNKQAGAMAIYCIAAMVVVNSILGIALLVKIKQAS